MGLIKNKRVTYVKKATDYIQIALIKMFTSIKRKMLGCICPLQVVLHPYFQNQTDWDNDLALIQLKEPVAISDKVTPIPPPERGQDLVDGGEGSGVITGWGWGAHQNLSQSLKHLIVPLVNHSACKGEYETN